MVEYEYRDLFYKSNQIKDILIVDSDATITPVSGDAPTITDATVEIHSENVVAESLELDESICSEEDLRFGLCESSRLGLTIRNKLEIPNLKEFGGFLDVYIYFNGDSDTLFQIGRYICTSDEYTNNRKLRKLEFYDLMHELYDLDITPWYDSYFSDGNRHETFFVIAKLFLWLRGDSPYDTDPTSPNIPIELDERFTLVNGTFPMGKTIASDTVTFGFLMEGILEFNGAFGHISRDGSFRMILMEYYSADPVRVVTDDYRMPPTNYNDIATWGIGQIDVYGRNNEIRFQIINSDKKRPSTYVMVDPWILADRESGDATVQSALSKLQVGIYHTNYTPSEVECSADLCVEVGDRINIRFGNPSEEDTRKRLRTYVLERHVSGLQSMKETYTSRGNLKQPKYQIENDNWHVGDSASGSGSSEISDTKNAFNDEFVEKIRNIGIRLLNEPSGVELVYNKGSAQVEIKWTDPTDITDYKPHPCAWVGTVVVRKEGEAPKHIWDGTILVDSTTRDAYKTTAFVDDTIEANKRYYYGIFPYHVALDDAEHPINHYRFTKVISVDTQRILVAPTITTAQADGTSVTALYLIPALEVGTYASIKLAAKKGNIPTSLADADKAIDIPEPTTLIPIGTATMGGLDELSTYYFVIFIEDELGNTAYSDAVECLTGKRKGIFTMNIITTQGIKDNGFKEVIEITQT